MPRIKITPSEGEPMYGTLPTSWDDTPLAKYATLNMAQTITEQCHAVAELLGVPVEPFLSDVSLLVPIRRAAPFLFDDSLPDASDPVPSFKHLNMWYEYVGALDKINNEQMEALLAFLDAYEGRALAAAPSLLAVLYCPKGQPQTAEVVAATATAFESLPMATAWPAIAAFLASSAPPALNIRTAWALENELRNLLETLEAAVQTTTVTTTLWQRLRRALTRLWLKYAKRTLWLP
jgi:hypothetical protein